jgi:LacI family transcriptional regulator
MVTIKDIARLANTSLGTVDRALNNKPGVNKATRQKILGIAQSLNYTPNRLGKALVRKRRNIKLGVILESTVNPYIEELKRGVEQRRDELADYGISASIFSMNSYEELEQVRLLEKLALMGVSGIVLSAINSPSVRRKIDELVDQGIKVVTCNTDNNRSKRSCFVGFQNELSGRVAAELLGKFTGGKGRCIALVGFEYMLAHMQRLQGFMEKIKEYPGIQMLHMNEVRDDDAVALEKTLADLEAHDITGIYVACFGISGVVNAIKIKRPEKKIHIIAHDYTPLAAEYVKGGLVDAIICQNPIRHGYMAMKILSELVMDNREPKNKIYLTSMDIRVKENVDPYNQDWEI